MSKVSAAMIITFITISVTMSFLILSANAQTIIRDGPDIKPDDDIKNETPIINDGWIDAKGEINGSAVVPSIHMKTDTGGVITLTSSEYMATYEKYDEKTPITVPWCDKGVCNVCMSVSDSLAGKVVPLYKKQTPSSISSTMHEKVVYKDETLCENVSLKDTTWLQFGKASTVIELKNSSGGIINDTHISSFEPNSNFGSATEIQLANDSSDNYDIIVSVDTSMIPTGATIDAFVFSGNVYAGYIDEGESFELCFFQVFSNFTYTEDSVTWNTRPTFGDYINKTPYNCTAYDSDSPDIAYVNHSLDEIGANSFIEDEDNITFYGKVDILSGTPLEGDRLNFYSKEYGSSREPIFYLTYTEGGAGDTTAPYYNTNGNNISVPWTYGSQTPKFIINWYDDIGVNYVYFEVDGVNYTASNTTTFGFSYIVPYLAVGYYTPVRWYACDVAGNCNSTTTYFNIYKATLNCTNYFDVASPIMYPTSSTPSCQYNTTLEIASMYHRNSISITNNTEIILGAGTYNYTCSSTDTENYTVLTDEDTYIVSQNTTNNVMLELNGTQGNLSIFDNQSVNASGYLLRLDAGDVIVHSNDTPVSNPYLATLAAGTYIILANTSGNVNYTANATGVNYWLTVNSTGCTPELRNDTWTYEGFLPPVNHDNITCNSSDILTLNWTNDYWNWTTLLDFNACDGYQNDTIYYDNGTIYNYTYEDCDFCTPDFQNDTWTYINLPPVNHDNITCNSSDILTLNWTNDYWNYTYELDFNGCDGYANDTFYEINGTIYNYTYEACDYCLPTIDNTTHINHANISCNTTDILTLNWSWIEWDTSECVPDNIQNISWYNYTYEDCDFCVPSLANTSETTTLEDCNISDQRLNWSWWEQWDTNECAGEFTNITWYHNETLSCDYCQYNITNTSITDEGNTTPTYINESCNATGYLTQNWTYTSWSWWTQWDTNKTTCCDVTGIGSDCFSNITWYDNTTYSNLTYNVACSYEAPPEPGPVFPLKLLFSYFGHSTISYGRSSGLTDTTSYWLCTSADCSSTCQVKIEGGLITNCI